MRNFRESLLEKLVETGTSLRQVAEGTGVSYEQLKKLKQVETRKMNVDDAIKVARYFDLTLEELIAGQPASAQYQIMVVLQSLSAESREFLMNAAKAQFDAEEKARQQSGKETE